MNLDRIPLKYRFILFGAWNTFFGVITFWVLVLFFGGDNYLTLAFLSFMLSTLHSHFNMRVFVHRSCSPYLKELLGFALGTLWGLVINIIAIWSLVEILNFSPLTSQVMLIPLLVGFNFFYQVKFVFDASNQTGV